MDAIVCPYDSALLYVNDIYLSYDWTGPQGSGLSSTFSHQDDLIGFYYVTVLDAEGCYLTSPSAELKEYSTPYLTVEPSNVLCPGESATITANVFGEGIFSWIHPQNATAESITVNQPGWYVCEMTQCGITVTDSVQIIDGSFSLSITASDSILCFGENIVVSAPAGLSIYEWSNQESGVSSISVNEGGEYYLTAYNNYGCSAISDTVSVTLIENSQPPVIPGTFVCSEGWITLSHTGAINWYTSDSIFISNGNALNVYVEHDTTILISYAPAECPIQYNSVEINLIEDIPPFEITGDTTLCFDQPLILYTDANNVDRNWLYNSTISGTGDTLIIPYDQLIFGNQVQLHIYNQCHQYTLTQSFELLPTLNTSITEDTIFVCPYEEITLQIEENYPLVYWLVSGDTIISSELIFSSGQSQVVYSWGIDSNGCQTQPDNVFISIPNGYISLISDIGLSCSGDSVFLTYQTNADSINWTTPNGAFQDSLLIFQLNNLTAGLYVIEAWDTLGCEYRDSILLTENLLPEITFPGDTILCLNDHIGGQYTGEGITITWNNDFNDSIIITENQWIEVSVTNNGSGCVYNDSIYIVSVNCHDDLPNIFTPNGDGINDFFIIDEAIIYPNNYLVITNRWGNIVFEEHGYRNTFGGYGLTDGVYFYVFYHDYTAYPERKKEGFVHIQR